MGSIPTKRTMDNTYGFEHLHIDYLNLSLLDGYALTGEGFSKEEADEIYKNRKPLDISKEDRKKHIDMLKKYAEVKPDLSNYRTLKITAEGCFDE